MEQFVQHLSELNPLWVYFAVASIAYIENIFPPFPSDVVVVAAGSLAGLGRIDFLTALLLSTTASTFGFITMYKIGDWFGDKILETGKIKFISLDQVHKVESWFRMYGYWVVVANRFLAGTRAVVAFFAGMSELSLARTTLLSFLSALVWNFVLLFAGRKLGENWKNISYYLEAYVKTVTAVLIIGFLLYLARRAYLKRVQSNTRSSDSDVR